MIIIDGAKQELILSRAQTFQDVYDPSFYLKHYPIATAKRGFGQLYGSYQTPLGKHQVIAKIGTGMHPLTVFKARRPTGQLYSSIMGIHEKKTDWILSRILWLRGLDVGYNRLGDCDTMKRMIYIHGTPADNGLVPKSSHGCIRMLPDDMVDLFDRIEVFERVLIHE